MQFDDKTHTYIKNNVQYISVTQLLSKYNLSVDYGKIPKKILQQASTKGKAIHKALELYIAGDKSMINLVPEVQLFDNYINARGINLSTAKSEEIVYDTHYKVAGTVDFQYIDSGDVIVADFKTTSSLHIDAVAWQLSVYNYLICKGDVLNYYFNKLKVFHFVNGKLYVKDIYTVEYDAVKELLEANLRGDTTFTYVKTTKLISDADRLLITQILNEYEPYEQALEKLNNELQIVLERVKKNMIAQKDYTVRTPDFILTYVAPQHRKSLNSKKAKEFIINQGHDINDFMDETVTKDRVKVTKLK